MLNESTRTLVAGLCVLAATLAAPALADAYGPPWTARHGMTSAAYQTEFDRLTAEGYRPTYVSGHAVDGRERFAAVWEQTPGPAWVARHGMTSAAYQAQVDQLLRLGYRPIVVNGYGVGAEDRYVAIWEQRSGPAWVARHGLTSAEYQAEFDRWTSRGYRPVHVSGYAVNGSARYAAIFEQRSGPAWEARHGLTSAGYQAEFDRWVGRGYRLTHVSAYDVGGEARFAAIFEQAGGLPWSARHDVPAAAYQGEFDNHRLQGYRPVRVSGYTAGGEERYAALWQNPAMRGADLATIDAAIGSYMSTYAIPGLSLAIAEDGRLVYARGFGVADRDTGERVHPGHLFRVASVSKPITAIAIMQLVEERRLSLSSRVFGKRGLLGEEFGTPPYSRRVKRIKVRHLLQHTSGWSNDGGDPMFNNPSPTPEEVISWMLDNREPKNNPGRAYEYLNFGYNVLGRIIERVTGMSYEAYVANRVLGRAGITDMQIAGDTRADRVANEVVYYRPDADPYVWKVARMDSHGGWLATPVDLLRLATRVDRSPTVPDILRASSIRRMLRPSARASYGMGWFIENDEHYHNGCLPGTIAFLVQRDDGVAFAVVANTRPLTDLCGWRMKEAVEDIIAGVESWPEHDLF